jgi:putative flippase GtrA
LVKNREILIFIIIGALNTSIDIGVFALLKYVLAIPNDSHLIIYINLISVITAIIFSYFANKYITFQHKTQANTREVGSFLIVNGLGFIVNTSILKLAIYLLPTIIVLPVSLAFIPSQLIDPAIIGKLLGTGGSMIVSFVGYKFFVFRK